MNWLKSTFCAVIVVWLSACATPQNIKVETHKPFNFNGRVAIKHHGERSSVSINWQQRELDDDILLLAPLGQTIGRIHLAEKTVSLEYAGKYYQANDAEQLTEKVLGWNLPLSGMRYWLQAEAISNHPAKVEKNEHGQVSYLHQDGWQIHYAKYVSDDSNSMPQRLALRRDDIEIILLIDEWLAP